MASATEVGFSSDVVGVVVFGGGGVVFGFFTFGVLGFLVEVGFLGTLVCFLVEVGFLGGLVGLGGLGVALAPVAVSFGAGVTTSDLFVDSSVVVVFLVDVVTLGARVVAFGVVTLNDVVS